jgi:hypothetical protein
MRITVVEASNCVIDGILARVEVSKTFYLIWARDRKVYQSIESIMMATMNRIIVGGLMQLLRRITEGVNLCAINVVAMNINCPL